jgi:UDP:flavonoid glycosyltransferase YjiC (YdhE family)
MAAPKYVFVTLGSLGDIAPFVSVALAMRARGHCVSFLSTAPFEQRLRSLGLQFAPLDTVDQSNAIRELISGTLLDVDPVTSFRVASRQYFLPVAHATYRYFSQNEDPARTVIVASQLAFGARLAREQLGFRVIDVHLQPPYSAYDPSHNLPAPLRKGPIWLRRAGFRFLERIAIDRVLVPGLDAICKAPQHTRRTQIFSEWNHSSDGALALLPEWFAAPQRDWPDGIRLVGFVAGPSAFHPAPVPRWLDERLNAGERFVVVSAGTGIAQARRYFETAVRLSTQLGISALLVTQDKASIPEPLPPNALYEPYVDFRELLPRVAALIHPAGIGTVATAIAAGCPQLLTPFTNDQPDNAARTQRLGAGLVLPAQKFSTDAAGPLLRRLLTDASLQTCCKKLSHRVDFEASTAAAAAYLEARAR